MTTFQKHSMTTDFYRLYDRIGEGVKFLYEIVYDFDDIMKNNINDQNLFFVSLGIPKKHEQYLERNHIDKNIWEKDMIDLLNEQSIDDKMEALYEVMDHAQEQLYTQKWNV